jgi:hypothetical protein
MSKIIINIFFQSVGPDELPSVYVVLDGVGDDELEKKEDAEDDSLGILESAVEENKLNADEESDGEFSTVPRAALSFGNSSIKFIVL